MGLLITYMFAAIAISALCSLLESVLLSTPQTFIATLDDKLIYKISEKKDSAVAAILIVNTIANTIGSSLVGIQAATIFDNVGIGIVSGLFTILILTCSEIIPKSIGTNNYKKLIKFACVIIDKMIVIVYPFVWCVNQLTKYFKNDITISEEEIIGTVETGLEDGTLTKNETEIIKSVLDFKDVTAEQIMTPATVVEKVNINETISSVYEKFAKHELTYSRIVVMDDNGVVGFLFKDNIQGYVDTSSEWNNSIKNEVIDILKYEDTVKITRVLKDMTDKKRHISAIFDEFGTFRGIVTLEDVIETILGFEIMDETDDVPDMQEYAKEQFTEDIVSIKEPIKQESNDKVQN